MVTFSSRRRPATCNLLLVLGGPLAAAVGVRHPRINVPRKCHSIRVLLLELFLIISCIFPLPHEVSFFVQNFAQLLTLRPLFPRSRPKLFPPLPTHNLVDSITSRSRSCS